LIPMKFGAAAAFLLLVGSSPSAMAADAVAPIKTKSGELGAPAAGKAQVVFFRPGSIMGAALGCTVHEGDAEIARLGSGKYYVVEEAPGKHEFFTKGEATDRLNLEVESDETYFVKCNIGMGVMSGRANLSPSDRAAFAAKAKGLKMWTPKETK
jgi:Protein of unknown function (DUF2846)